MLRGIDLPKIYLRKIAGAYDYEVADGQQRLSAIYSYFANEIALPKHEDKGLDLSKINGQRIGGKIYEELPEEMKEKFDNYPITIALIEEATNNEIRTLFGRLQEGDSLVPPEKRNAIISGTGNHIDSLAINHKFFIESKIPQERFKRQDYMTHAVALIAYKNEKDLKANLLLELYLDKSFKIDEKLLHDITTVLDYLSEINSESKNKIYKKFHFVDFFWFIYQNLNKLKSIDIKGFATAFDEFEKSRLKWHSNPAPLISTNKSTKYDKDLHTYVVAFKTEGALTESIENRYRVFQSLFFKYLKY
jgi:hypothetical protein